MIKLLASVVAGLVGFGTFAAMVAALAARSLKRRLGLAFVVVLSALALSAESAVAVAPTITEFSTGLNSGSSPYGIAAGPDGNLWFTDIACGNSFTCAIGEINPTTHAISEFSTGLNSGSRPYGIAAGPDGNLWFTDHGTPRAIGEINPTTHGISEFSTGLNSGSYPYGIAAGPDGNLWFTDILGAIGEINPTTHAISEFSTGLNSGSAPYGIAAGPDGNLWFADTSGAIGEINPTTHAISEFSTGLNSGGEPYGIAAGPDGNLWFTDIACGNSFTCAIGEINPTTHAISEFSTGLNSGSEPRGIAAGPDGNLWFTDPDTPAIGEINPTTHAISEFSGGKVPIHIAAGPDGNMWFTDASGAIGEVTLGSSSPPGGGGGGGGGGGSSPPPAGGSGGGGGGAGGVCLSAIPSGYVITAYLYRADCGAVEVGGFNAAQIALPADGLIMCAQASPFPVGYVITHVHAEGGPLVPGACGVVYGNSGGYNAVQIQHPSDGLIICDLGGVSIPPGYVFTHVYAEGGPLVPGACGVVYGNIGYNAIQINLPANGMVICAPTGVAFAPTGYVFTAEVATADCGQVFANVGYNALQLGPASNKAALATKSMIAGANGALTTTVTCPGSSGGCSGSVSLARPIGLGALDAATAASRASAIVRTLARGSFAVAAGQAGIVKLRLNAAARKLLSRSQVIRARATLVVHEAGGTRTTHETVTIRAGHSDAARVTTALRRALAPHGRLARIRALLKHDGYPLAFKAPTAGRAVIDWYYLPNDAQTSNHAASPVLVAAGIRTLSRPGAATIEVKLSERGRQLLASARRLRLTAQGTFTPAGQSVVFATRAFTLVH